MSVVIKIENLSKQYRLGMVGSSTMRDDVKRFFATVRGKEDPFLKIGESNDNSMKRASDYVWSLKDINFEVQQGDVLGIIGKNGAGKSTLLKILSKVTAPTTGKIKINGRIASLLEVGTGFHPELTGKENIFLNGAILGMRKKEIASKLDEIIDFAGVERYIDTPVKRYSSGMYVRLAFAVAAHLEPEILVVDEVLAVGDAEFQKKCLGKIKDVSRNEGRTILFVSHNMEAVRRICNKGIVLEFGTKKFEGPVLDAVQYYENKNNKTKNHSRWELDQAIGNENIRITEGILIQENEKQNKYQIDSDINANVIINAQVQISIQITFILKKTSDEVVFEFVTGKIDLVPGDNNVVFTIPKNLLNKGVYNVQLNFWGEGPKLLFYIENLFVFETNFDRILLDGFYGDAQGSVHPILNYKVEKI